MKRQRSRKTFVYLGKSRSALAAEQALRHASSAQFLREAAERITTDHKRDHPELWDHRGNQKLTAYPEQYGIILGRTYRDVVTGFQGPVVMMTEHFNGCAQACLQGKSKDPETEIGEMFFIDYQSLEEVPDAPEIAATPFPDRLPYFELGTVVRNHRNTDRLAFIMAERSGGFASVRGRFQALCNDLGITSWHAEPLEANDGPWLAGRGAKLIVNDEWVGCFGEIDPAVASLFDLRVPLNGAEIDVAALMNLVSDPV